jgi:uncharacterized membrane protein YphA (DoxX/SURF4 family)
LIFFYSNHHQQLFLFKRDNMTAIIKNAGVVQRVLKYTYGLVPIVAGLDKFTNLLTDWKNYLNLSMLDMLPFSAGAFMSIVGIIEIAAGILVLIRPRTGGVVVMAWLIAIALTLIFSGHYFDLAVRDLVMATGAWSLATLSVDGEDE